MEFVPGDALLRIFLVLLCAALSSAERFPWIWSRDALSEVEKPCGSLIRPNEGGQQQVFRFRLDEAPSTSLWRTTNEVEESVRGECAVAIVAPKGSSRLAVGVDLAAVEGDGAGQCLSGNHIALYDLQGGRLILKDTICGWQKAAALMESTSNIALVTINLRGVKKGSFILKVSVLREGEYLTTTGVDFWVPPATATPEKYQEHTEVFLVPETTETSASSEEQTTESVAGTTKEVEATTTGTTKEDNDDKDITEEGYDPVKETTTEKEKMSTTKKPKGSSQDKETTESPDNPEEMGTDIEGSGFGSGRTTEKPSGGPGGSGIEFILSPGAGDRRTTTELPVKPEGSGIEFVIPSASSEGRTTGRPGGSGIVFLYPSGHGIGRTTADYHRQSSGDYVSIPWAEASEEQGETAIPNQSITDTLEKETPKELLNGVLNEGTTPLSNIKETEALKGTGDGGSHTTLVLGDPGNSNTDLFSDEKITKVVSSLSLTPSETSSVTKPSRKPGIEFVYPGRPSFALVSDDPSLLPDFPLLTDTTTRAKLSTRPPQDSGIVFLFHEESSSTEPNGELVRSLEENERSKETIIERRVLNQPSSTLPPRKWPTLSVKWIKHISPPSTDSLRYIDGDAIEGLRKEADSTPPFSTAMTPEYLRVNHSKTVESIAASILKTGVGGTASENLLSKKKKPLRKKVPQNDLQDTSKVITTKSAKKDPWSGIQMFIPKNVLTSSLNKVPITPSLVLSQLTSPSISADTEHKQIQRRLQVPDPPSLPTTDRSQPADPTIPMDASFINKNGNVLDTLRL